METLFENTSPYGLLLHEKDLELQRKYFREMARLIGMKVLYRAPKETKHWTTYAEIESNYYPPTVVDCIYNEHPDVKTMKKLGWAAELADSASLISVPYDLSGLQVGALFVVPDVYNPKKGRLFKVVELSNIMIAPASITCQIVPEYEDTFATAQFQHTTNTFSYLNSEEEPNITNG